MIASEVSTPQAIMLDKAERPAYAEAGRMLGRLSRFGLAGATPWNLEVSRTSVWRKTS